MKSRKKVILGLRSTNMWLGQFHFWKAFLQTANDVIEKMEIAILLAIV